MKKETLIYMGFLAAALPALAEDGPSFDCAKAASSAEELVCADPELASLDRDLAATYQAALDAAQELEVASDAEVATLRAKQRGWVKGRDECWKSDDLADCVRDAYLRRTSELTVLWMLQEPFAETAWQCEGNPANEVFVMFFETVLPTIRVEYGDSITAMTISRTASGSRYDGDFGRYFWEKAGEASFAWEEGVEQRCTLVAG